jgi:hypothetical protein
MPAWPSWIANPPSLGWNPPDGVVTTPSTVTVAPSGDARGLPDRLSGGPGDRGKSDQDDEDGRDRSLR